MGHEQQPQKPPDGSKRNIKNVADDVRHLVQIGLIECSGEGNRLILRVNYEAIDLRIAV